VNLYPTAYIAKTIARVPHGQVASIMALAGIKPAHVSTTAKGQKRSLWGEDAIVAAKEWRESANAKVNVKKLALLVKQAEKQAVKARVIPHTPPAAAEYPESLKRLDTIDARLADIGNQIAALAAAVAKLQRGSIFELPKVTPPNHWNPPGVSPRDDRKFFLGSGPEPLVTAADMANAVHAGVDD
jgi:hypothetical protein